LDSTAPSQPAGTPRSLHPVVFTVLIVPFGAATGYVSVALAFLATRRGLSVQQGAELIALGMLPQIWKFFWAPVGDTTLTRKRWYVIAAVFCAAGMFASAAVPLGPATLPLMSLIVLATSVATTFLGFSVEALMAHLTAPADRGRTSGWYQAGNLGGGGIGGGVGLWLLNSLPAGWETGLVLAASVLACMAVLPLLPDVPADARSLPLGGTVRLVGSELWKTLWSRNGILCTLLCFVPIGTGTAAGVMAQAVVAAHWGAGSGEVELVQGFASGILSMAGCIAGGYGCARLGARVSYAVYGAAMAVVTLSMAFLPATPLVYLAGNLVYAFVTGLCYAAFTAFVLDAIGAGVAATKYNGFASVSNIPIWYMGLVLAAVDTRYGPRNMLLAESACGVAGILVFAAAALAWRPRVAAPA
jgi:hypothetical protein